MARAPSPCRTFDRADKRCGADIRPTGTKTESGTTVLAGTVSITDAEERGATPDKRQSWESSANQRARAPLGMPSATQLNTYVADGELSSQKY